ncbi:hypothetical protein [Pectinatus frisingensis]|uniref:hypothetical protein n=1 Tax=Pectinatus frisingensis TaxID=865 RepID=UPI0018C519D1|nr:hypothetical protein [Pectinatus frisingensis]
MSQRTADKARTIIGAMFRDGMNKQEMLELLDCTREMVTNSTTLWDVCRRTPQERRELRPWAAGQSIRKGYRPHIVIHEYHMAALEAIKPLGKK